MNLQNIGASLARPRIAQKLLARSCEAPLLDGGMLGRNVEIAHPPLQQRTCEVRCAAVKLETRIDGAHAVSINADRRQLDLRGPDCNHNVFQLCSEPEPLVT